MPHWSHEAPPEPRGPALPIRRTPAFKPLLAIITSQQMIGCYTHFYKGKTVPCEGDGTTPIPIHSDGSECPGPSCALCPTDQPVLCEPRVCEPHAEGIPFRWHAYVSAVDRDTNLHFIFECTAQASDALKTYRDATGSLRGCLFQATRLNKRPNGRIVIQTKPADLTERKLPDAPDLTQCLAILWSLPIDSVDGGNHNPSKGMPQAKLKPPPDDTTPPE